MTTAQLEQQLLALEETVEDLKKQVLRLANAPRPRMLGSARQSADDSVFEELVRRGAAYRQAFGPGA